MDTTDTNATVVNPTLDDAKPKRKRAPRAKATPAPKVDDLLVEAPTRELDDLVGVDLENMTSKELQLVAADLLSKCNEMGTMLMRKDQELRTLNQQLNRYQSFAGYVRETIDHARNSLLLQADALNIMSRGNAPQKG